MNDKRKEKKEKNVDKLVEFVGNFPEFTGTGCPPKIAEAARHFDVSEKTIRRWADNSEELMYRGGVIYIKKDTDTQDRQ